MNVSEITRKLKCNSPSSEESFGGRDNNNGLSTVCIGRGLHPLALQGLCLTKACDKDSGSQNYM